jgi:hypothetical protein
MFKEFVTPKAECAHCGYKIDRAANTVRNEKPHPGDFTICMACAKVLVFNEDLKLRKPSPEETERANKNPWITQVRLAISNIVAGKLDKKKRAGHH